MLKPRTLLAGALVLFSLISAARTIFSDDGLPKRSRLRADLDRIQTQNAQLRAQAELLEANIDAMRNHPTTQEAVVRDQLGYVRPGDLIVELPAQP